MSSIGFLQKIDADLPFIVIHDPIFPNAGFSVDGKLQTVIHPAAGGRHNLYHPVGRAMAPTLIQPVSVTYDRNVRFKIIPIVLFDKHAEGSRDNPAFSLLGLNIVETVSALSIFHMSKMANLPWQILPECADALFTDCS